MKQVWFDGDYTLIGRGNQTNYAIPNVALAWMIKLLIAVLDQEEAGPDSGIYPSATSISKSNYLLPSLTGKLVDNPIDPVNKLDLGEPRTATQHCRVDKSPPPPQLVIPNEIVYASVRRRFWLH